MSAVAVLVADGFETIECLTVVDVLRRGGVRVDLVSIMTTRDAVSSQQIDITCDYTMTEVDFADYDYVVLPGGMPGTLNLENSEGVQRLIDTAARQGALLGAICAAPSILGHKGLLNGKTAVCFPGFEKDLTGAVPGTEETVRDGNIITSRGAGSAVSFGLKLVEALYGEKQAEELGKTIQWRR